MTKQEQLRYEYFIETGIVWIDTNDNIEMDYLKWVENKALTIPVVSNCTTCNDEINYKGVCEMCYTELKLNDLDNELTIPVVKNWVAIEEALPEIREWVLCCNTKDDWTDFAEINHNDEGKIVFYNRECEIYPTHWKELPKPPCL
jgi:hypothetical protein